MTRSSGPRRVLQGLALVVIVLVAFFAGMLVERLQSHAQRDDMLRRYDRALQEHRSLIMESEKRQVGGTPRR
ncbi:MAG TPA: hypothetical protein VNU02_17240 [Candidatus Dormibacteraeota bacterium]|jgi:hypothetical protein|nr:hypothetical protein [Candidatus Dormibacteraeota bacterium]